MITYDAVEVELFFLKKRAISWVCFLKKKMVGRQREGVAEM